MCQIFLNRDIPASLQQYRVAAGAFNSRFNHINMHNIVSHRKPNVSSITSAYFAIIINFCTFLSVFKSFCLIAFFRKNIKTINLLATKILFIKILSTYNTFHVWLCLIRTKPSGDIEQNPGPKPNS